MNAADFLQSIADAFVSGAPAETIWQAAAVFVGGLVAFVVIGAIVNAVRKVK